MFLYFTQISSPTLSSGHWVGLLDSALSGVWTNRSLGRDLTKIPTYLLECGYINLTFYVMLFIFIFYVKFLY